MHAPLDCGLNLWEIGALPLRAPTAYHLWRRAEGLVRGLMQSVTLADLLQNEREVLVSLDELGGRPGAAELPDA